MNLPTWTELVNAVQALQAYGDHIAIGAGAAGALLAAYAIRRFLRTREHDEVAANLGVLLFLVVTTEGMWEVVHGRMGVAIPLTVAMFAAYDVVIYSQGATAVRALARDANARIGSYLLIIWALSAAASITVSFASGNAATWFFRFFSPLVAASLWTQKLLARRARNRVKQESSWIWTPTRLMIRWGWLKPGAADDLTEVFAARRIAALVDAGLALHAEQQAARLRQDEPADPSRWRIRRQRDPLAAARRRVQRLTKTASAEDVAAARTQLRRVLTVETELFRDESLPTQRERELMDELRLVMRQATTNLRAEGARAFAPAHRDPVVELGGIRMPAHIAARISAPAQRESARESLPAQNPARRMVTAPVADPDQLTTDARLTEAYARLTARLGRKPTGPELGQAAGVSKATANRWMARINS